MLIQDFVHADCRYSWAREQLLADPRSALAALAAAAYQDGAEFSVKVGFASGKVRFGKRVAIDIGVPYDRGDWLVLPISWSATGPAWLFPCLDGDLEVTPLGDQATLFAIQGRYEPPFASVGQRLDRVVLHRITEASVRSLLMRIAHYFESGNEQYVQTMLKEGGQREAAS